MKEFSILLVEDDPDIVELYKEVMENFENVAAEYLDDGDVALKAVQTTQYDCIVLDIHLPGADGLQIAKTTLLRSNRMIWQSTAVIGGA